MNTVVLASSGSDMIRVPICLRIVGNARMVLSGLITLKTRSALKLISNENSSTKPEMAIIKSMTFHPSLRYDFQWITKPIPIILRIASDMKMIVKTKSTLSMI